MQTRGETTAQVCARRGTMQLISHALGARTLDKTTYRLLTMHVSRYRRLAASCTQLGQNILSGAYEDATTTTLTVRNRDLQKQFLRVNSLLSMSSALFQTALLLFDSISDDRNRATLTCNVVSVLRLQANWVLRHPLHYKSCLLKKKKIKPALIETSLLADAKLSPLVKESLYYLQQGLSHCVRANDELASAECGNAVCNNVALEMAQTLLTIGMHK
jgi:hypothetical protein